jgi:calcium binding protein 39
LVQSDSYVTKRQSIKLLGEILLDRAHYNVMTAYVDSGEHLKLCMKLLKDDRKMVQYEGFHVFKVCPPNQQLTSISQRGVAGAKLTRVAAQVFVANPNKSVAVQRILINNRERLLKFLPKFLEDRTDDDQFTDEKSFLVRQIELLPKEPMEPARLVSETRGSGVNTAAAA